MFGYLERRDRRTISGRGVAGAITALAIAAALALTGSSAPASAATSAAPSSVQFSSDGVTYSPTFPAQSLFGSPVLVPQSAANGSFWVRNGAASTGFLRISLANVTIDNSDFASALSVRASTPGWPGTPVALSAAQPCYVLSEGQVIPAGGAIKVDAALALANLNGLAGQGGNATFSLIVAFSSTVTGSIPSTDCPSAGAQVPGTDAPGSTGPVGRTTIRVITAPANSTVTTVTGVPPVTVAETAQPVAIDPVADPIGYVVANTGRFFQEYTVALWVILAIIGSLLFLAAARRRDRAEQNEQNGLSS